MGIFLRHSYNVKPPRWGSPADVQYAIKVNSEKIYNIDPDSNILVMPGFWGLPPLDYSRKNNHGTNNGATYKDGSLDFDGGNDCVKVHNPTSLDFTSTSKFSVGLRINVHSCEAYEAFITKSESGITSGYNVGFDNTGKLRFITNLSYSVLSSNILPLKQSLFCEVVFDTNNSVSIYIDGILDNTGSVTALTSNTYDLVFGRLYVSTASYYFHGTMGEVRINNIALTAEQVALFHDLPYGLYQPVSRPIYFFQAAVGGLSIPVAMSHYLRQMGA